MAVAITNAGWTGNFDWYQTGPIDGINFDPQHTSWTYNAASAVSVDLSIQDGGSPGETFELLIDGVVIPWKAVTSSGNFLGSYANFQLGPGVHTITINVLTLAPGTLGGAATFNFLDITPITPADTTFTNTSAGQTFDGGLGVDTVTYAAATASVSARLDTSAAQNVGGGSSQDRFFYIENLIGSADEDVLTGSAEANRLEGGGEDDALRGLGGDDTLIGGTGKDTLDGGDGGDLADYRDTATAVVLTLAGASSSTAFVGGVAEDAVRNVERIAGGSAGDTLTGDGGANLLNGHLGNDILKGGAGKDSLYGSVGIDTADYRDKAVAIQVTLAGAGLATVFVGGVAEDSVSNIEVVYGGLGDDLLTGDSAANLFRGGGGADQINGGGGVDAVDFRDKSAAVVLVLNGATAVTATVGGAAEDTVRNVEQIYGGTGGDILVGDGAANLLSGGGGADTLRGALAADTLTGGTGADTFVYNNVADSTVALTGRDTITDFVSGTDKIRLTFIDANTTAAGDQAFVLGVLAAGAPGRLQVSADGAGKWLIRGDVNGDGTADFAVSVLGAQPVAADFIL